MINRFPLNYTEVKRRYSLLLRSGAVQLIFYCLWCGAKLPSELGDEYFSILEKEYNLDDPYDEEQEKQVPEEFKSDEWWKKRGF